jgi:DNA-binding transcriptional LysR family regulator
VEAELRHLRAFEVVAQELNFTRAAVRLHVSQQALSAQIRELEHRVGAELLVRTSRSVALTDAGRTLLRHVPGILLAVGQALAETRAAGQGPRQTLTVGLAGVAGLALTPAVLRAFSSEHPAAEVTVRNVDFSDASGGLASGETDVALVWLPVPDGIEVVPLIEEPRVAVLASDHPLASAEEINAADLADEPFVWIDEMDARVRDFWTLAEYRVGRPIRVGARITGFEDSWAAIRAGMAVAASPKITVDGMTSEGIVTRPVRGLTPALLGVCCRPHDDRSLVRAFVETVVAIVAPGPPA